MRIGDKDIRTVAVRDRGKPPKVLLQVMVWGICMAEEEATPDEARQLARLLDAAADQAEGRAS